MSWKQKLWQTCFRDSNSELWNCKKCYNILTLGFETAKRWNYISEIPNTKGPSEHYKKRKAWSSEHISKILDQIQDDSIRWMNSRSNSGVSSSMAVYCFAFSTNVFTLAEAAFSFSSRASFLGICSSNAFCSTV